MNPDPVLRSDLLAAGVPAAVVVIGSLVGFGLWGGSHRLSAWWLRRYPSRPASAGCFALRLGMGTVALWSCWQAAARWVVLETSWSLWTNAVIGALTCALLALLLARITGVAGALAGSSSGPYELRNRAPIARMALGLPG